MRTSTIDQAAYLYSGSRPASRTSRHSSRTGRPSSRINRPVSLINRPGSRTSQRSRGSQDTDYPTAEPSPSTKRKRRVGVDANAPLWEVYFEETTISDRETIKGWTGSLESLLLIVSLPLVLSGEILISSDWIVLGSGDWLRGHGNEPGTQRLVCQYTRQISVTRTSGRGLARGS